MEWVDLKKHLLSRKKLNVNWKKESEEWDIFPEIYIQRDFVPYGSSFKGAGLYFVITLSSEVEHAAFFIKVLRTVNGFELESKMKKDLSSYMPDVVEKMENILREERLFLLFLYPKIKDFLEKNTSFPLGE